MYIYFIYIYMEYKMKNLLIIVLAVILTAQVSYSQEKNSSKNDDFLLVQTLINQDLYDNYKAIQAKADNLNSVQKQFIYEDKSKSSTLPFILNFIVGFGVGSWVQGHTVGGLIGTIGHLGGAILLVYGKSNDLQTVGLVTFFGTWITECILPWTYAHSYNNKLKSALGMSSLTDIRLVPALNLAKNNTLYPGLALTVKF